MNWADFENHVFVPGCNLLICSEKFCLDRRDLSLACSRWSISVDTVSTSLFRLPECLGSKGPCDPTIPSCDRCGNCGRLNEWSRCVTPPVVMVSSRVEYYFLPLGLGCGQVTCLDQRNGTAVSSEPRPEETSPASRISYRLCFRLRRTCPPRLLVQEGSRVEQSWPSQPPRPVPETEPLLPSQASSGSAKPQPPPICGQHHNILPHRTTWFTVVCCRDGGQAGEET